MTPDGYAGRADARLENFPTDDDAADTARMNRWSWRPPSAPCPRQYYWVHKRFKTRPRARCLKIMGQKLNTS